MKKIAAVAATLLTATILIVAAAFTFGGVSLVSTTGISMEPALSQGDLVILRPTSDYSVGDVVSYRSSKLSTVVLHRIVAIDGDRYTFKGDNNDWLDPEQARSEQLVGELALRIPGGGIWLDRATRPATVAAVAFLLLVSGGTTVATRRQRRKKRNAVKPTSLPRTLSGLPPALRPAAAAIGVLAVASVLLGAVSWTRPTLARADDPAAAASKSAVSFSYRATVPRSAAYDNTTVTQPQPVFRKLTDEVEVEYRYEGDLPVAEGRVRPTVELATANGWQSTLRMGPPETFTGSGHTGRLRLRLSELQAHADAAAKAIGEGPAAEVFVTVVPEVTTGSGTTFRPQLPFALTPSALRLYGEDPELVVSHSGSRGGGPALATVQQPTALTVLGQSILVTWARIASLAGLALAAVSALLLAAHIRSGGQVEETDGIRMRYSQVLLPVEPMVLPTGRPVVEVPRIEALVRLAERYGLFVMHWERGGTATYVVLDEGTTYRYRSGARTEPAVTAEPALAAEPPVEDTPPAVAPTWAGAIRR